MDHRKRLYKAGPRDNPTLSERVKETKNRRQTARIDKFAAGRKIPLDDSLGTPVKAPAATKISQIVDRNQKLNAYRLQKNTQKFKEIQEQKSPFIVTVPVGRWIEKKERFPQLRIGMNDTPVRNALMNERVLKKSTVKNLIAQSTAKKENVMIFGKSAVKPAIKSKKRILGELNAVHYIAEELLDDIPDLKPMDDELNTTFEISPEPKEPSKEPKVEEPIKRLRLSNSLPEIVHKVNFIPTKKMLTPPTKNGRTKEAIKKALVMKANPMSRAVVKKPVVARKAVPVKAAQVKTAPVREKPAPAQKKPATVHVKPTLARVVQAHVKPTRAQVEKVAPTKCIVNKVVKKNLPSLEITHDNTEPIEMIENPVALPVAETEPIKPIVKKKEPIRSQSYKLYKSSVDIQISYLTMQISELMNDQEIFLEILTEDQQTFVHQTAQQGNLLISDKLKRFEEFLDKFENDLSRPDDPKRVTEDDVDNYWYLIYDEIEKLKKDLSKIKDTKRNVLASQKKRRTRKTYVPADGTPKRSIRIAVNTGTPKHSASCYGCVTMSGSKMNTPKSVHKRRTTMKKSNLFEAEAPETPKRGEGKRQPSKRNTSTNKRSLHRMDAVDGDVDETEMDIGELL